MYVVTFSKLICQMLFVSVLLLYLYPILVSYIWAAFTSVSHIGEWVPAATEENLLFLLFRKENRSLAIPEYLNTGPVVLVKIM